MWVSLWLPLDVLQSDNTCTYSKWFQFSSVHFDLITQECCISNIQEVFMWVLGPINGMTSSLNSVDQHNVLHMSSAHICLNDLRKNKFRRTWVDSSIWIIDQQPRTVGGRIPKSTKQSTSRGVRVWYNERHLSLLDILGIQINASKNFVTEKSFSWL